MLFFWQLIDLDACIFACMFLFGIFFSIFCAFYYLYSVHDFIINNRHVDTVDVARVAGSQQSAARTELVRHSNPAALHAVPQTPST